MTARDAASATGDSPGQDAGPRARVHRPAPTAPDPFGDVLPDRTRDEEAAGWGERGYDDDECLRREVPPHHG